MLKPLLAAAVLALSAIPAFADLETPISGTATSSYGTLSPSPFGSFELGAIDGVYVSTGNGAPANGTVTFNLVIPASWGQDLRVFVTTGNIPYNNPLGPNIYTFEIQSATYTDGGGNTLSTGTMSGLYVLAPFSTRVIPVSQFTVTVGAFDPGTVTSLQVVFIEPSLVGSGNTQFQIDRISNPEPGTLALFGLGALGLGGFAMRRRKAKKAAAAKA